MIFYATVYTKLKVIFIASVAGRACSQEPPSAVRYGNSEQRISHLVLILGA